MIPKLEMLIALAKEQHFGRAAESLGITQPTLSSGIRQLEDYLGVKLVTRGARFGGLTPEGQRALETARQIVGDMRRLRQEMRFTHHGLSGQVRLAVIPTALAQAARLVNRFKQDHPGVKFQILSRTSSDILSLIENLEVDAGLTYLDNEPLGRVAHQPLYRESYQFVCAPDHALAGWAEIRWPELAETRLCLLTPDMQNRRIINRNFMEAGLDSDTMLESNSTLVLVASVLEGDWATILPTDLAAFLAPGHDLVSIPISGGVQSHSVGLVAQYQEPQTPVLKALFDATRKMAKSA